MSATDAAGRNALHLAARQPGVEGTAAVASDSAAAVLVARQLLDAAASRHPMELLCALSAEGVTPLVYAAASGLTELVSALLGAGASATECDGASMIAAARHGRLECARVLMDGGAEGTYMPGPEGSAMHVAAGSGRAELLRLLLERITPASPDEPKEAVLLRTDGSWRSPLLCAAAGGHGSCVEILVAAGSPIGPKSFDGTHQPSATVMLTSRGPRVIVAWQARQIGRGTRRCSPHARLVIRRPSPYFSRPGRMHAIGTYRGRMRSTARPSVGTRGPHSACILLFACTQCALMDRCIVCWRRWSPRHPPTASARLRRHAAICNGAGGRRRPGTHGECTRRALPDAPADSVRRAVQQRLACRGREC